MDKYYLIKSTRPLDFLTIETLMDNHEGLYSLNMVDPNLCYFRHDDAIEGKLLNYLRLPHSGNISILVAPYDDDFTLSLLDDALAYFPNTMVFPHDVIMKQIGFGNYSSFQPLRDYFARVPLDLLETAGAYLRAGLNGLKAAETLYIHRNTFNARISNFISLTALDIRDYHNALLLEFYFQLSLRR